VAVGHEQNASEERENKTNHLDVRRKPAGSRRRIRNDYGRRHVLKHRGGRGVAGVNGGEVRVLNAEETGEPKGSRPHGRVARTPRREDPRAVLGAGRREKKEARDGHANRDEPSGMDVIRLEEDLRRCAGDTPENGA